MARPFDLDEFIRSGGVDAQVARAIAKAARQEREFWLPVLEGCLAKLGPDDDPLLAAILAGQIKKLRHDLGIRQSAAERRAQTRERVRRYRERRRADVNEQRWRAMWKAEGRLLRDYDAGIDDLDGEVWEWRRAKGRAAIADEDAAWLRDHPGDPLPEHLCSLSDEKHAEYVAWRRKRQRA